MFYHLQALFYQNIIQIWMLYLRMFFVSFLKLTSLLVIFKEQTGKKKKKKTLVLYSQFAQCLQENVKMKFLPPGVNNVWLA